MTKHSVPFLVARTTRIAHVVDGVRRVDPDSRLVDTVCHRGPVVVDLDDIETIGRHSGPVCADCTGALERRATRISRAVGLLREGSRQ